MHILPPNYSNFKNIRAIWKFCFCNHVNWGKYSPYRWNFFSGGLYFRETSHMRSFVKIKPSPNGKITLSIIDIGKPCFSHKFFTSLICLLMLFAKIKFSRKFPNLQYLFLLSTFNWQQVRHNCYFIQSSISCVTPWTRLTFDPSKVEICQ